MYFYDYATSGAYIVRLLSKQREVSVRGVPMTVNKYKRSTESKTRNERASHHEQSTSLMEASTMVRLFCPSALFL